MYINFRIIKIPSTCVPFFVSTTRERVVEGFLGNIFRWYYSFHKPLASYCECLIVNLVERYCDQEESCTLLLKWWVASKMYARAPTHPPHT